MPGHLVAILHSLPISDGSPTLRRVDSARRALECSTSCVANLFPAPLANVKQLNRNVGDPAIWEAGRIGIQAALSAGPTDVLLGYGQQLPTGAARAPFREQLHWLSGALADLPVRLWMFGGRPAHPSRWQRVSFRHQPGATIDEVAKTLLVRATAQDLIHWQPKLTEAARDAVDFAHD